MYSGFFLQDDQEWMTQSLRRVFEFMRSASATEQWIRYQSNWPIALRALRQLWETGKVSELKSPFWESPQKPTKKLTL